MKSSDFSPLNKYYVKRIGLILAGFLITLSIVAKLTGILEEIELRLINVYILLSLLLAAFSKEKVDDERSQKIRYFSLKFTFNLLIIFIAFNYLFKFNFESIYLAISSLIIYLVIFYLANYFNPKFIFKEDTNPNRIRIIMFVGGAILIGFASLYNIIRTLIGF